MPLHFDSEERKLTVEKPAFLLAWKDVRCHDETGRIMGRIDRCYCAGSACYEWSIEVRGRHVGYYMTEAQAKTAVETALAQPEVPAAPRAFGGLGDLLIGSVHSKAGDAPNPILENR